MNVNRSEFRMETVQDTDPDLSYLGEYSTSPGPHSSRQVIDRKARGDMERNQFRYFHPTPDESNDAERAYSRMEAYNRGDWHMIGVRAVVTVAVPLGTSAVTHRIASPGLWGIESDSGDDYIASVFRDECDVLANMLEGMGLVVVDDREGVESAV